MNRRHWPVKCDKAHLSFDAIGYLKGAGATVKLHFVLVAFTIFAVLFLVQPLAVADTELQLVGPGTSAGWNAGGVYTSPYSFNVIVDGTAPRSTTLLACDDFDTEVWFGETWDADVSYLSAGVFSPLQSSNSPTGNIPKWGPGPISVTDPNTNAVTSYTLAQAYYAAGYLAYEITNDYVPGNDEADANIASYAIWQIFSNGAAASLNDHAAVSADMQTALTWGKTAAITDPNFTVVIYTPTQQVDGSWGSCQAGSCAAQEFLGITSADHVPEASTLATLASELLFLAGGIFLLRKKISRRART